MPASPASVSAAQTVAVVAFDGISPFHLSVPCLVFGQEMAGPGMPRFRLLVCAPQAGPLRTPAGFRIDGVRRLSALVGADIVIIPSWHSPTAPGYQPPPEALLKALRAAHRRGARIVGLCLGAFVLAEAGLLDGRPATTHWALAPVFAQRYPQVALRPDVLYVDDGDVLTSAGTAAGIDCCLHLLRTEHGAEVANHLARRLVVAPHRQGGQAQYVEQPLPASGAGHRLSGVLEWVQQHLDRAHSLDDLARRALLSRRSFTRHFRQVTGTTVGRWLLNQRLALAQRQLESTHRSIEQIAADTGFGSAASLRQHFAAAFRVPPSLYRREFRAN
ncbi:GlxA family transcriptional regulator [Variovorax terrae]|uniref:Helix-turn-helix domain-containing protein n=1 Tax=Variovorax terrae TaxID=2923278 RepID=A0A9X1W2F6_9BURK|nr:helix-turn-helix domain-containing protein [Variovorax terrae]MCJ0764843.1 helix-turn-helix domain-containing protein [Variovorax terrae]